MIFIIGVQITILLGDFNIIKPKEHFVLNLYVLLMAKNKTDSVFSFILPVKTELRFI